MLHAVTWFVVSGLLAVWSLGAWAFHAAAAWAVANAGVIAGGASTVPLRVPDWLAPWLPPEVAQALASMLSAVAPALEGLVQWVPALGSGLSVLVWVGWGLGTALLVVLGLAVSGTIAVVRRRTARPALSASAA
ncbi:MAG: hypothetical protein ABW067_04510 [Rhizobacter sp.]